MTLIDAGRSYIDQLGLALVAADDRKRPLPRFFPHGVKSATRDLALLERALRYPGATLAARVGHAHFVLDVDVRHRGLEQLERLEQGLGQLPTTWRAVTPSGGLHVWFRGVDFPTRGRIGSGIEILRGDRLVTLAPSQLGGGRYRWLHHPLETTLAEAPLWVLDLARLPSLSSPPRNSCTVPIEERERRARAYAQRVPGAISGAGGHAHTIRLAVTLVRGFELDADRALAVLSDWNRTCSPKWSTRELHHKIKSAMKDGRMPWGFLLGGSGRRVA